MSEALFVCLSLRCVCVCVGFCAYPRQMTVADIMIAYRINGLKSGVLDGIPADIADAYPNLVALHATVVAEPKIAAFMAKHAK